MTDVFTKFTQAVPTRNQEAATVGHTVGVPDWLTTGDWGEVSRAPSAVK